MENKNILISGAGIAGTALAFWLRKFGFNPTVVESAPKLRDGGYAIDFWGAGVDVAERMGILQDIMDADLGIPEVTFVDKDNVRKSGLNYLKLKELMNNRAYTLLRSDLSRIIYERIERDVEFIFGDSISKIEPKESDIKVTFKSGTVRNFDLVVGADGLHSNVRRILFGPEEQFEKFYSYYTSSFSIEGDTNTNKAFLMYNVPGKQAAVYSTKENKTTVFFIFTSPEKLNYDHHDVAKQKQILREQFQNAGWKCQHILDKMNLAQDFYFDAVSQIKMNNWSKGRITLVGDACCCPSLLSGQGSTLAIVGAYILAGELKNVAGNYKLAYNEFQAIFKPFIDQKQRIAQNFAKSFVAKSTFGIWMRNVLMHMMFLPFLSKLFVKQFSDRKLKLKEY